MQREQLERLKRWFDDYVSGHYVPGDEFLNNNLRLKECHTRRVRGEMRSLSAALSMNGQDAVLAEAIALLHDVGRFAQFKTYRTYKDSRSENHSVLGLRIMDEHRLIDDLPTEEQVIIRQAVEFHGAKELPTMDERAGHFAKMIRDVDKLDIYCLCVDNYRLYHENRDAFVLEVEFPDSADISPYILEAVLSNRLIDYGHIRTLTDAKLMQLGWVFDVYFDWTLRQMRDRGYIEGIARWLPDSEPAQRALGHVQRYVDERLDNHDHSTPRNRSGN
jgi:hypothetical protein